MNPGVLATVAAALTLAVCSGRSDAASVAFNSSFDSGGAAGVVTGSNYYRPDAPSVACRLLRHRQWGRFSLSNSLTRRRKPQTRR